MNIYETLKTIYESSCKNIPFLNRFMNCNFNEFINKLLSDIDIISHAIAFIKTFGKDNIYMLFDKNIDVDINVIKEINLIINYYITVEDVDWIINCYEKNSLVNFHYDFKNKIINVLDIIKSYLRVELKKCDVWKETEETVVDSINEIELEKKHNCLSKKLNKMYCSQDYYDLLSLLISTINKFKKYKDDKKYYIFGAVFYYLKKKIECKKGGSKTYKKNNKKKSKTYKTYKISI